MIVMAWFTLLVAGFYAAFDALASWGFIPGGSFSDVLRRAVRRYPWRGRIVAIAMAALAYQHIFVVAPYTAKLKAQPFLANTPPTPAVLNVRDYGAAGDGKTDDSPAFERAIADLESQLDRDQTGGVLHVPGSPSPYLLSRPVRLRRSGVSLVGDSQSTSRVKTLGGSVGVVIGNHDLLGSVIERIPGNYNHPSLSTRRGVRLITGHAIFPHSGLNHGPVVGGAIAFGGSTSDAYPQLSFSGGSKIQEHNGSLTTESALTGGVFYDYGSNGFYLRYLDPTLGAQNVLVVAATAWAHWSVPVATTQSFSPGNGSAIGPAIWGGTGAPSSGLGADGDYYLRSDGGTGSSLYQHRSGAWVALL